MPSKKPKSTLPWKLIIALALVQLVRPVLSTTGTFDNFKPEGPLIVTTLAAIIWVSTVVILRIKEPVKVLALAGATYAVLGVIMAVFLQTFFEWSPEETVSVVTLLTAGLVGGIAMNVIWGAMLGFVALGVRKRISRE